MQQFCVWLKTEGRADRSDGETGLADSPLLPSVVRQRLHRMLEHAGCERVRFHDLRHPYVKHATKIFSLRLMDRARDDAPPKVLVPRICRPQAANKYNHFLSRPVRERKYFSICRYGFCPSQANKFCAQQPASLLSESRSFFDNIKRHRSYERCLRVGTTYFPGPSPAKYRRQKRA